jgi:dTDP-4-dehydrorhamnose reductase
MDSEKLFRAMTLPRILLLGKSGQVGSALRGTLASRGIVSAHDRATCNLENVDQLRAIIRAARPNIIVNAGAYTAVDDAEIDQAACHRINTIAPAVIANEAKAIGAYFIHYSTDYVFDGNKAGPYLEDDPPCPLNAYGRSKLAGDQSVLASAGNNIILRIGWVYGLEGENFAKTILRRATERDELEVVDDQFGVPTSAELIADVTSQIVDRCWTGATGADREQIKERLGIFNVAPMGRTSWHGYATELVREALRQGQPLRVAEGGIVPVASENYPGAATRPRNSLLDTSRLRQSFSIQLPEWQADVKRFVSRLGTSSW